MPLGQGYNSDGEPLSSSYVVHDPVDTSNDEASLTRQEFAEECDINILMAQYERTGVISHYNNAAPQYLDLTDVPDLHKALGLLERAEKAFMTLPAVVRREFDNDPTKFVQYCEDSQNLPKLREWGLAAPEPVVQAPIKVEVTNPAPSIDPA